MFILGSGWVDDPLSLPAPVEPVYVAPEPVSIASLGDIYILGSGWVTPAEAAQLVSPVAASDYVAPFGTDDMGNPIYAGPFATDPNSAVPVPDGFSDEHERNVMFNHGEVLQIDFNRLQWGPKHLYAYYPGLGWIINEWWGEYDNAAHKSYSSNFSDLVNAVYTKCRDAQITANGQFILGSCPTTLGVEIQTWQLHVANVPAEFARMFAGGKFQIWGDPNNYMVQQPSVKTWKVDADETAWQAFMGGADKPWWGISPAFAAGGIAAAAFAVASAAATAAASEVTVVAEGAGYVGDLPLATDAAGSSIYNPYTFSDLSDLASKLPFKPTDALKAGLSYLLTPSKPAAISPTVKTMVVPYTVPSIVKQSATTYPAAIRYISPATSWEAESINRIPADWNEPLPMRGQPSIVSADATGDNSGLKTAALALLAFKIIGSMHL